MNNHGSWYPFRRQTQFAYGLIMSYTVFLRYFMCLRLDRILMTSDDYVSIYVVESVSCVSLMMRWTMKVHMAFPIGMMRYFYVHMSSAFGKSAVCATSLNTQQMTGVRDYYPMCRGDVKEERPPLRLVLLWNHMNPQFFDVINAIQRPYLFVSSI